MTTLRSPDTAMFEALHRAMTGAFADYVVPMQLSFEQFALMMRQRSLDLPVSSVAVLEGEIAAFWLVGLRGERSYLIASGTLPKFRRRGLSKEVAGHAFARLRACGVASMSAEVISGNDGAAALYRQLGFGRSRVLDCYAIPPSEKDGPHTHAVSEVRWSELRGKAPALWDFPPSWQNDVPALDALEPDLRFLAGVVDGQIAGYAAILPASNTLCQLAVDRKFRRRGIASSLLAAAHRSTGAELRLSNVDARDQGFRAFLMRRGARKTVEQSELCLSF